MKKRICILVLALLLLVGFVVICIPKFPRPEIKEGKFANVI